MITPNDSAQIRRLHAAEWLSEHQLVKSLSLYSATVARALAAAIPRNYSRPLGQSKCDDVKNRVARFLREFPDMSATVLAERLERQGPGLCFRKLLAYLRPRVGPSTWLTGRHIGRAFRCSVIFGSRQRKARWGMANGGLRPG